MLFFQCPTGVVLPVTLVN